MKEIITQKGGSKVKFTETDFLTANKLKSILTKAVKKSGYSLSQLDSEKTIEVLDCDDDLVDILFKCLERCTFEGEKISRDTFEPVSARVDYYEIMLTCLEINYTPFVKAPNSMSKELQTKNQ